MNSKLLLFSIVFFFLSKGVAQKVWTLDECITYAIEHNLQLNDFEFNSQSNKESYKQSIRDLLPVINGFADYSVNFGRSINPEDNSFVNT